LKICLLDVKHCDEAVCEGGGLSSVVWGDGRIGGMKGGDESER